MVLRHDVEPGHYKAPRQNEVSRIIIVGGASGLLLASHGSRKQKKRRSAFFVVSRTRKLSDQMNRFFDCVENFVDLVFADNQRWRERNAFAGVAHQNAHLHTL